MANYLIRDMPEALHRTAKGVAGLQGISLRELILRAIGEYLERTIKEGGIRLESSEEAKED